MGEYERFEKIRTNLKESKIIPENRTESEKTEKILQYPKEFERIRFTKTQHELIDTGREPEKKL